MPSVKNSPEEIDEGARRALAAAIANLDAVDGESVAGLLDAYLDASISSRSSHDWDPLGRIDAAVSSRSSHSWDPQNRIDVTVSSRSSHDWDPNGTIAANLDAPVSDAGGATPAEVRTAVNDAQITNDIYRAIERRISEIWETTTEFGNWTTETGVVDTSGDALSLSGSEVFSDTSTYSESDTVYRTATSTTVDVSDYDTLTATIDPNPQPTGSGLAPMSSRVQDTTNGTTLTERTESTDGSSHSGSIDVSGVTGSITLEYQLHVDAGGYPSEITAAKASMASNSATVTSPAVGPPNTEWDVVNFDAVEDGGTVTVDVVDASDNVLAAGVTDGEDIGSISASKSLALRVTLDGSTSNPALNRGILRWID